MKFVIIDYSKGNVRSVQKSLELAGVEALITADTEEIRSADALVLPGVGAFADASEYMLRTGQMQVIRERIHAGIPFLGICLGMQLLYERGDEGMPKKEEAWAEGLGILQGSCKRIASEDAEGRQVKVPHVGWNQVEYIREPGLLFTGIEDGSNFYFTHSYQCCPEPEGTPELLATVTHAEALPSVVGRKNAFGVQFHPEKSSHKGLRFMKNFVDLVETFQRK